MFLYIRTTLTEYKDKMVYSLYLDTFKLSLQKRQMEKLNGKTYYCYIALILSIDRMIFILVPNGI